MGNYATLTRKPPRTLTELEQAQLLKVMGEHARGFRDHMLVSLALGTGLRESELLALDVGDVSPDGKKIQRRVVLRVFKRAAKDPTPQETFLPDSVLHKLEKYLRWKKARGESLDPAAPLFVSRNGGRLSTRMVRMSFRLWQTRAGFERPFTFHALRHTAISNLYRSKKDIRLTQKFARHRSILTTSLYTHPSDEDLLRAVRELPC